MHSKELWPFVFLIGLLMFNYPIMDLVQMSLPFYLYAAWGILIGVIGILATIRERGAKK